MTTATYHPAATPGQEQWAQGVPGQFGHQPWGPQFGGFAQQFGAVPSLYGGQPGSIGSQIGFPPQIASPITPPALLSQLISQHLQVLQLLTQVYAQLAQQAAYQSGITGFGAPQFAAPQFGMSGQRPYQMSN